MARIQNAVEFLVLELLPGKALLRTTSAYFSGLF
jgi:hypothetical protein